MADQQKTAQSHAYIGRVVLGAALLFVVALGLRLWHAGDESLGVDEAYAVYFGHKPWTEFWAMLPNDAHPPLFYLAARVWVAVTDQDFWLRVPIIAVGLGIILAAVRFAVATPQSGRIPAIAACLMATSCWGAIRDDELRMYPLLSLFVWIAMGYCAQAIQNRPRAWVGYGVFTALSLYTHYNAALVLGVPWVAVLTLPPDRRARSLRGLALAQGLAVLAFAPWIPTMLHQLTHQGGATTENLADFRPWPAAILEVVRLCLLGPNLPLSFAAGVGVSLLLAAVCVCGVVCWPPATRVLLAASLVLPLGIAIGVDVTRHMLLITAKHGYFLAPALALAVASALNRLRRDVMAVCVAAFIAINFYAFHASYARPSLRNPPWREFISQIESMERPGDALVMPVHQSLIYEHYARKPLPIFDVKPAEADTAAQYLKRYPRVWLIQTYAVYLDPEGRLPRAFDARWRRLYERHFRTPQQFDDVTIVLYGQDAADASTPTPAPSP